MFSQEEIKLPVYKMYTTSGLTSDSQILNTTAADIFARIKDDTASDDIKCKIHYVTIRSSNQEQFFK